MRWVETSSRLIGAVRWGKYVAIAPHDARVRRDLPSSDVLGFAQLLALRHPEGASRRFRKRGSHRFFFLIFVSAIVYTVYLRSAFLFGLRLPYQNMLYQKTKRDCSYFFLGTIINEGSCMIGHVLRFFSSATINIPCALLRTSDRPLNRGLRWGCRFNY